MEQQSQFIVIGLNDEASPRFADEVMQLIGHHRVFSGGARHRTLVERFLPADAQWIDIRVPLADVFRAYEAVFASDGGPIVVFASGDPLFFGFANTIRREMPRARLRIFPTFNSLQLLAHRLQLPYHDLRIVSLTGRPWQAFDRALIERAPKIGLLTDRAAHTPRTIAERMACYGFTYYKMYVGERLGNSTDERVGCYSVEEAATRDFDCPNCVILEASDLPPRPFGIPDDAFQPLPGRPLMITKAPIRLLTLQALALQRRAVLWDIGFCTGSVSIEARTQFPHLAVVAFEVREEGRLLMDVNSRRLHVPGITAIIGDFMTADLSTLARPDAVFIGGHGGRLAEMMARVREQLLPGGCIVMNSVTEESRTAFMAAAEALRMELSPSVAISLNDYHPIHILSCHLPLS